jgi:hypothetical protein
MDSDGQKTGRLAFLDGGEGGRGRGRGEGGGEGKKNIFNIFTPLANSFRHEPKYPLEDFRSSFTVKYI